MLLLVITIPENLVFLGTKIHEVLVVLGKKLLKKCPFVDQLLLGIKILEDVVDLGFQILLHKSVYP